MNGILSIGDCVTLRTAPKNLAPYSGCEGQVTNITPAANLVLANVRFTLPDETTRLVPDIPAPYLAPVRKQKRKGVLNLHEPKDTRTEAEKLDEIIAWLSGLGYVCLGVGQHRAQAVCWNCTRKGRAQAGPNAKPVKVFCKECGTPAFSPNTGNAEGYPDLSIRHEQRWHPLAVLLIEGKRNEKADKRAKQVELAAAGWSVFAHDKRGFAQAIRRYEHEILGIDTLHEIEREATKV